MSALVTAFMKRTAAASDVHVGNALSFKVPEDWNTKEWRKNNYFAVCLHMQMCFRTARKAGEKDSNRTSGNVSGNLGPLRVKGVVT